MQQHARPHPRASSVRSLARGGMRALSASSAPACQEGGRRSRGPRKWYNAPGPAPDGLRRGVSGAASALIHCRVSRCSELARCSGPPTEVRCPHHRGTGESLPHACRWWQIGSPNGLAQCRCVQRRLPAGQGAGVWLAPLPPADFTQMSGPCTSGLAAEGRAWRACGLRGPQALPLHVDGPGSGPRATCALPCKNVLTHCS